MSSRSEKKLLLKIEFNPSLHSFYEGWSVFTVIRQAIGIKHGDQETVVSLNVEILKDVVDRKVPIKLLFDTT